MYRCQSKKDGKDYAVKVINVATMRPTGMPTPHHHYKFANII